MKWIILLLVLTGCPSDRWDTQMSLEACGKACAETGMQSMGPEGCTCRQWKPKP